MPCDTALLLLLGMPKVAWWVASGEEDALASPTAAGAESGVELDGL
jgi:hypothetical protein